MHDFADAAAWFAVRALVEDPGILPEVRTAAQAGIGRFTALADVSASTLSE
jgi:hypothetical protein